MPLDDDELRGFDDISSGYEDSSSASVVGDEFPMDENNSNSYESEYYESDSGASSEPEDKKSVSFFFSSKQKNPCNCMKF
jgi:hypothetical protein